MEKIKKIIESCVLCIKYPFLYPRNRFTDLHYTNWDLHKYLKDLYTKAYIIDPVNYTTKTKNIFYVLWYYIIQFIYEWICPLFHCIPTYTEWDAIPTGWKKAFGDEFLKELGDAYKKLPRKERKHVRILQIKEKYGELCVYINGSQEMQNVIEKYCTKSYYVCIDCGKPATKLTGGYICPYCDNCVGNRWVNCVREGDNWKVINKEFQK